MLKAILAFSDDILVNKNIKYTEKHSMINDQATPKTQLGGVQGA